MASDGDGDGDGVVVVLWQRLDQKGLERCTLRPAPAGWLLAGTIVAEKPCVAVRYRIACTADWRTRSVNVWAGTETGDVELALEVDAGGCWRRGGQELVAVRGCLDVDLQLTPSTNTLPLRRLAIPRGSAADVTAAWVRFPRLEVVPLPQKYTRTGDRDYRYESPGFTASLEVDGAGLVTRYGSLWQRV